MPMIVTSPQGAVAAARDRVDARLGTFPCKVWAEGHTPDKEPIFVFDTSMIYSTVEQAIYVSRDEHGKDGAVIEWGPNRE